MKKFLLAILAVAGMSLTATAQKTELYLGYGGYTQMDASDMHDGWGNVRTAWGAITAGLNFKVAPNIWIGPSYTFSSTTTRGGAEHSKIAYHAILFNGRYEYYNTSIVTLYGHLGLGVEISHMQPRGMDSFNNTYFGVQASPLGAQVNINRNFTIFGEVGYGVQGLLQVGCRINL